MSQEIIKFEVVTPERVVVREDVLQASIPTKDGEITILPHHIPLVSIIKPGVIEITKADGSQEVLAISGGFVEVLQGKIVILADTAEIAEELDEARIQEVRARAEELKKNIKREDKVNFADISIRLEKELARDRAVQRWKRIKHLK
jgi:F-type H+-transporting ATPase subunit epsilon